MVTVIIDRYGHVYVGGGIIAGFGIDTGASFGWTQDPMTPDEFSIDQSIQGGGFNFDVGYGLGLSFGISDDWYNTTNVGVSLPTAAISYTYMFDEQQIRDFFK